MKKLNLDIDKILTSETTAFDLLVYFSQRALKCGWLPESINLVYISWVGGFDDLVCLLKKIDSKF